MRNLMLLLVTLAVAATVAAQAPVYPDKTVTIVVPFPAGGSTDMVARVLGQGLQAKLGQSVVVDNRPGATGTIGAGQVKRAPADGYTLMVSSLGTFVIAPHLLKSTPYDATQDFDYLSVLVQAPNVLVASDATPARTVADVLQLLKSKPGKVSFASSGNGSSDHLSAELFWLQTGTEGLHVPYKGGAPAVNDLLGGQVDFSFQNVNAVLGHIRSGKLRAIAVTGTKRSDVLPDVPTLAEAGVKGAEVYSWQGFAAPKGLPAPVKGRLSDATVATFQDPAVKKRMADQGIEVVVSTPEQTAAYQAAEFKRWKDLIEKRKITAE